MADQLTARYGKQCVPVFKILKNGPHHSVLDMVVDIMLEGDVSLSWTKGENSQILPTETQKNTCYACALENEFDSIEDYALALGRDILSRHTHIKAAEINVIARKWRRAEVDGHPHNHVFFSGRDPEKQNCMVRVLSGGLATVSSGLRDMKVLKTTQSGFSGFIRDKYTNLQAVGGGEPGSEDRILCTELDLQWTFTQGGAPERGFNEVNEAVAATFFATWSGPPDTGVYSLSLQETTYNASQAVLDKFPSIETVKIQSPNVHYYKYPLEQFGLKNPNVVFQSTDCHTTASGRIETTVTRKRSRL